jgi:Methyltransferase domain/Glycosyl transferase family 2
MITNLPTLKGLNPRRNESTAWSHHIPFGYDLVAELRPRLLVEVGAYTGQSYFTFCQSVSENATDTLCYALNTWNGDRQVGFYPENVYGNVEAHNQEFYAGFSYLLRMTFDEARAQFPEESIGLLHIDAHHTYEAVRRDYDSWLPRVSPDGIVLLHAVAVRRPGYGVWKLWEEIARPGCSFIFDQGSGLGVVKKSPDASFDSEFLNRLFAADEREKKTILNYYSLVSDSLRLRRMMEARSRRARMRRSLENGIVAPLRGVARVFGLGPKSDPYAGLPERRAVDVQASRPFQGQSIVRVVCIACVKNEIDIVEAFVRHTVALADSLVVLDNGSTDGTLDVLRALERMGLALEVVEDPSPGHWQWRRMTRLMKEFAVERHGADWVLPLDADEFLVPAPDRDLGDLLVCHAEPLLVSWRTYVPDPADDPTEVNPALRIRHRLEREAGVWQKVFVPRHFAVRAGATISQGSHSLLINGRYCRAVDLPTMSLAHIPIRSPGQHGSKVALVKLQHLAMSRRSERWGWHHAAAYDLLKRDPATFSATWREAALHFAVEPGATFAPRIVLDPIPYRGGALLFTPSVNDGSRTLRSVLEYAESLARLQARQEGG